MNQITFRISLIVLLCIAFVDSRAQFISDSLNARLQKNLSPEDRVTTMALLARSKSDIDAAYATRMAEQALQMSQLLHDPQYKAFVFATLTNIYYLNNDTAKAQKAADSAVWLANKTPNNRIKGFALLRKGWLQGVLGNPHEATATYFEALRWLAGSGAYDYECTIYYYLAGNYAVWNDLPNQQKYAQLSLQTARKSNDPDNLALAHQAMATYYHYAYTKQRQNRALLDSALLYNLNGIKLFQERGDHILFYSTLAIIEFNTANLYEAYFPATYKDSVLHYLEMALKTGLETHELTVVSVCYGIMSDYEIAKGNYKKAETLLLSGLSVLRSYSPNNWRNQAQFMEALSALFEKKGDWPSALKYYKEFYTLHQKLYDAEKLAIANRLEAQYQSEKKEVALKTLRHTAAMNKKLNYLYISLAIAAIIALLFIVRFFQWRLKATLNQQQLLQKEKEEATLYARLKEAEAMRLQAEQQLLQERQERLQKELLAGSLQVEQKNELLQNVQKKIEESKKGDAVLKQINQIIDQDKRIDDTMASYKADFNNIHPEFFEKLKQRSANTLSRLDLKHCSYISIGLTNKEIAQRLGIAPKSILMARYRIKLKLGLKKEDDLDEYIGSLK